jgi:hypothetical protein
MGVAQAPAGEREVQSIGSESIEIDARRADQPPRLRADSVEHVARLPAPRYASRHTAQSGLLVQKSVKVVARLRAGDCCRHEPRGRPVRELRKRLLRIRRVREGLAYERLFRIVARPVFHAPPTIAVEPPSPQRRSRQRPGRLLGPS